MISAQLAAEIRRLSEIEGWPIETIARHLTVHHSTVRRVLALDGLSRASKPPRPSMLDPFVPFVKESFERHPQLRHQAAVGAVAQVVGLRGGGVVDRLVQL